MGLAIGAMLPLAIGIAISPTTITTAVLMLSSAKANPRTVSLLVGCAIGVAVAVTAFAVLSTQLPAPPGSGGRGPWHAGINLLAGASLVVIAATHWRRRPTSGEQAELPKWMSLVDSITPARALVLGFVLTALLPKNLLLALSAGLVIGGAELSVGQAAIAISVFTVIAVSSVGIPVVASVVSPERMRGPLEELRVWLVANNAAIMVVVLLVIGVVMIGNGFAG